MERESRETGPEIKMESAGSFEDDVIELIETEAVESTEPKRDRDFLTEEQRERFVLDSSAEKKLMSVFENNVETARVTAYRKYISDNPEDFGMEKEYADNLSEEQVRNIMEGDRDKVNDVASRDPRYVEVINLREMLKEAKGDLDYDEKFMFFRRIDSEMIKDPVLLRELREKLWEAMEGEKIDDRAVKMMQMDGSRNREKYVKMTNKMYRTARLIEAMGVKRSQITERMHLEEAKKGQETLLFLVEELIIKEKIEEIKKKTGWDFSEEDIIALSREGYDLVKLEPCENISGRLFKGFRKFKIEGKKVSLEELKSVSEKKSPAVAEEMNSHMKREGERWDSRVKKTKEKIIGDSLKEIPAESAERVYEKYKKIRFVDEKFELEIEENMENRQTYSEMVFEGRGEFVKAISDLYHYGPSLKDVENVVGKLCDTKLNKFIMSQNLSELAKREEEMKTMPGKKRFWYELFFDLTAEFLLSEKNLKRTIQEMIKMDKSIISGDLIRPLIRRAPLDKDQKEKILGNLHYIGEDARVRLLDVIKDIFIIEERKNDAVRKLEKL